MRKIEDSETRDEPRCARDEGRREVSEEIKKCPFCGKPGETTGSTMYSCSDPNCPAFTIVGMDRAAWNKRVLSPAVKELVEAGAALQHVQICECSHCEPIWAAFRAALAKVEEEGR
jgi:hypothetical protein